MDVNEEDIIEVVDTYGGDGAYDEDDEGGEMADEEETEEVIDTTPKEPRGPDTSLAQLRGHTAPVYAVAVSPDGLLAISGGGDDIAILWALATQTQVAVLRGHTDSVVAVAWNTAGTMVATGSLDSSVKVWDRGGNLLHTIEGPSSEVEWLAWHPKGDVLLAGSNDATAWMWHVVPKTTTAPVCMTVFAGHEGEVSCGAFAGHAGKMVVTGSSDGTARLWNPKSGRCIQTFEGFGWSEEPINAIACSLTRPLLVMGGQDGTTRVASLTTFKLLGTLVHRKGGRVGESSRGGSAGVAGSGARTGGGGEEEDAEGEDGDGEGEAGCSVESVAFCESDAHPWVASGATDGTVLLWDLNTCAVRQRLLHEEAVVKLAWTPNATGASTTLVVATADGCLRVWDGRDGSCIVNHTGHAGIILDFAPIPIPEAAAAGVTESPPAAAAAALASGDEAPRAATSAAAAAVTGGADAVPAVVALVSTAARPLVITGGDDGVCRVYALAPLL